MTDRSLFQYGRTVVDASQTLAALKPMILTWQRLEPAPVTADLTQSLQAQIADPLWFLMRQWQFAEFIGEDAGTPTEVSLMGEKALLSRYRPGATTAHTPDPTLGAVDYQHLDVPLEVMVERESIRDVHPRLAAEAGEHLLRLLAAQGVTGGRRILRDAGFGLEIKDEDFFDPLNKQTDPRGREWQVLFAGRALDGRKLAEVVGALLDTEGHVLGMPFGFDPELAEPVRLASEQWIISYLSWVSEPTPESGSAWIPERQEYALALSAQLADQSVTLAAEEYTDGQLDWYSFNATTAPALGDPAEARPSEPLPFRPRLPTPARYPGMPADRYWEFEDARVNLGNLDTGPSDLGKLLLAEYGLVYGNDWFLIPIELDVGSVFRVTRLIVKDTFGVPDVVPPSRNPDGSPWKMFNLSNDPGGLSDLFFLPPTLPFRLDSDPLERVALFRDEMANMAWAVEQIVQGAAGQPRERRIEPPISNVHQRVEGDHITADLIYRLATPVPQQWLPFVAVPTVPEQPADSFSIQLEQRIMLATRLMTVLDENGNPVVEAVPVPIFPEGVLMTTASEEPLRLHEEEVPREGSLIERTIQYTRWLNGQRFLWVGRRKRVGKGEGSSSLRYDVSIYNQGGILS